MASSRQSVVTYILDFTLRVLTNHTVEKFLPIFWQQGNHLQQNHYLRNIRICLSSPMGMFLAHLISKPYYQCKNFFGQNNPYQFISVFTPHIILQKSTCIPNYLVIPLFYKYIQEKVLGKAWIGISTTPCALPMITHRIQSKDHSYSTRYM